MIIELSGCSVVASGDGDEALKFLRDDAGVDLVLTDIVMPGGTSGLELTRSILSDHPAMSVVLMSGHSPEIAQREGMPAGNVGYLQKPFSERELLAMLEEVRAADTA